MALFICSKPDLPHVPLITKLFLQLLNVHYKEIVRPSSFNYLQPLSIYTTFLAGGLNVYRDELYIFSTHQNPFGDF